MKAHGFAQSGLPPEGWPHVFGSCFVLFYYFVAYGIHRATSDCGGRCVVQFAPLPEALPNWTFL